MCSCGPPEAGRTGPFKAGTAGAGDYFGHRVAMTADGNILAVAAVLERSAATGIGGDQSDDSAPFAGAVCLY